MENKIKVGQSFDVVEILHSRPKNENNFKIGGHTLSLGRNNQYFCNGISGGIEHGGFTTLALNDQQVKKIGKLTITKVK
ncbi:hypothetical protein OHD16_06860 [Sphingobacterium sp. ML3W]|uniref:hypothetical protein n=1 Tax=Sphingobacterium sp. ML3W TaxID=1538644 RepID=UPI00249BFC30|nr:hypothetical protein [Sphingobacterium sp. ML3W]WFA79690.1 hypothetical protein OGI71_27100 [Sphingobacterium sp. ML3W]